MKAHAYGNTVSNDLWKKIDAAGKQKVTAIAHDFTLQPGVPMINVDAVSCVGGQTKVTLTQGEFSKDAPNKKPLSWRVPVIAQTVGNPTVARVLVSGGKATLMVPGCGTLLVNAGQTGYYRTHYAAQPFQALTAAFATLAPIDQLGLMTDTYALGNAGLQPASDVLALAKATPLTADPQVWGQIAAVFNGINDLYQAGSPEQKLFATFAIDRLAPVMTQTGWLAHDGEPAPVTNLRETLISVLSQLGDPAVIAEARRRYAAQASDPTAMPPALRKAIMRVVARHADAATWDALHSAAMAEKTPLVKSQLYDLLGSSEDAALAQRALQLALSGEPGATDSPSVISRVSVEHPDMAFDFALANLDKIDSMVDSSSRSRYLPRLSARSFDPAMPAKLTAYANSKLAAGSRRDAETSVVGIQYRIKVRTERLPAINAWLAANVK
jgi:aminopeptidase N